MKGRLLALVAALLVTGCIAAPKMSTDDKTEAAAMANKDLAENAALAWNPDAKLVGAGAGELAVARDPLPADPHVGNGKAVAWTYLYRASNDSRAFEVAADGHLMSSNASDSRAAKATDSMSPLGDWKVDSAAAMDKARANATFERVAKTENATFAEMLGRESGKDSPAIWYLVSFASSGAVVAQVDAVSGELLEAQEISAGFPMPDMGAYDVKPPMPPHVSATDHGSLDDARTTKTINLTLPDDGMQGVLRLRITKTVPVDGLSWTLKGPDGAVITKGELMSPQPDDSGSWKLTAKDAGDYVLTLTYENGAPSPVPTPGRNVDYDATISFGAMPEMPGQG